MHWTACSSFPGKWNSSYECSSSFIILDESPGSKNRKRAKQFLEHPLPFLVLDLPLILTLGIRWVSELETTYVHFLANPKHIPGSFQTISSVGYRSRSQWQNHGPAQYQRIRRRAESVTETGLLFAGWIYWSLENKKALAQLFSSRCSLGYADEECMRCHGSFSTAFESAKMFHQRKRLKEGRRKKLLYSYHWIWMYVILS